jgi:hypothetical protein
MLPIFMLPKKSRDKILILGAGPAGGSGVCGSRHLKASPHHPGLAVAVKQDDSWPLAADSNGCLDLQFDQKEKTV